MKCRPWLMCIATLAFAAGGCAVGPAQHTGDGTDYSKYVLALYNDPGNDSMGHRTVEFPISVAVAQIGQVAPDPAMLTVLRDGHDVFRRVEPIPAPIDGAEAARCDPNTPEGRQPIRKLQALARDMGLDYVLVCGATVDTHGRNTGASIVDLTIVGAYVIPSREIAGSARASAALVDVRTGRVVMSSAAESRASTVASAASFDGDSDRLGQKLEQSAYASLAKQVVDEAERRNGATRPSKKGA